ncbi:MAG: peptidoglycan-binding domain-containing protein [Planctomycetota bacterium]
MSTKHRVRDGDCIDSIAFRHGLLPDTVWSHPENADLRKAREDPNLLLAGDEVFVPELAVRRESGSTGSRHRFVRKAVPSSVAFRVLHGREPVSEARYILTVDGVSTEGETDESGKVEMQIPPDAEEAVLQVFEKDDGGVETELVYEFALGGLDPFDHPAGQQERLQNLGFSCDPDEPGEIGEGTRAAVVEFQRKFELSVTGELDDATDAKIRELHGA